MTIQSLSQEDRSYEKISPTAWFVAYQRTFSDIPFSQEIFIELQEILKQTRSTAEIEDIEKSLSFPGLTQCQPEPGSQMAFKWEARYKIVNYLLKAHHINQILEIASGVSPRGLEMARDPSVEYVEVDLIDAIQVKKDIIKRLIAKSIVSKQPNLHLEEGNALNLQDLLKATRFFGERPIAVVNEGFLDYLDLEEKTIFARNVHRLLERFGGIWITPDIPTKAQDEQVVSSVKHLLSNETLQERAGNIRRITGVDILKNRFESEDVAQTFFENLGFIVEQHRSSEVIDELVSPQKGNQRLEEVEKVIRPMAVFVMEIDPSKS